MNFVEYILKFGFMFGLSIVLMIYGGPAFFKKVESDEDNINNANGLVELRLNYAFESTDYIQFLVITKSNDTLLKNYYLPDREYTSIISFLFENNFIGTKKVSQILPLVIREGDLQNFNQVSYSLNKNSVESLSLNNQSLIGQENTKFKKALYYLIGGVICVVGLLGFLLSSLVFLDNIKIYQKTGALPDLPNSVSSKIEGLKYIFRGFKSQKK